jgi:hypothetical protein
MFICLEGKKARQRRYVVWNGSVLENLGISPAENNTGPPYGYLRRFSGLIPEEYQYINNNIPVDAHI